MNELKLVLPETQPENVVHAFKQEFFEYGEPIISGSGLLDQLSYKEWLAHTQAYRQAKNAQAAWVPSTTFFALRKADQQIVGIIDIRHHINHPFLRSYAGHIGYAVRPAERRKGYASEMLQLGLEYAQSLGLKEVMLGCHADNVGSYRTIEKQGGVLTEENVDKEGKRIRIYWIQLEKA